MADSKIEWCDKVWNPVVGCTRVSAGCDNCYAIRAAHLHRKCKKFEGLTRSVALPQPGTQQGAPTNRVDWTGVVRCCPEVLDQPLKWRKPSRVFVNSMGDLFHEDVPVEFVARVWSIMASATLSCRHPFNHEVHKDPGCECWDGDPHTFIILTKRPMLMKLMLNSEKFRNELSERLKWSPDWPWPNVQLGVSVENQEMADLRIPLLLQTPAAKRIVSLEPMLGAVDLRKYLLALRFEGHQACHGIHGVICGGESGPGARPMHPDWVRSVRDQCVAAGVPFFFKQWGEWAPYEDDVQPPFLRSQHGDYIDGHVLPGDLDILNPSNGWMWDDHCDPDEGPDFCLHRRVGKKKAGRLLDGRIWDEYPTNQ